MQLISKRNLYTAAIAGLMVSGVAATPARAQSVCDAVAGNLLTNCGFEFGNAGGWSLTGNGGFFAITSGSSYLPNSGSFYWDDGAVGSMAFLSQTLATNPGDTYNVSFYYNSAGGHYNEVFGSFAGTPFVSIANPSTSGWYQFTASIVAPTNSSVYTIGMRNDPSFDGIDDNVVVDANVTPEPASLVLLATGLVGIVARARRRRTNVA